MVYARFSSAICSVAAMPWPDSTYHPARDPADGDDVDPVPGLTLEDGQQRIEQPGVTRRGGGGEEDLAGLSDSRTGGQQPSCCREHQSDRPTVRPSDHHHRTCSCTTPRLLSSCSPCSRHTS